MGELGRASARQMWVAVIALCFGAVLSVRAVAQDSVVRIVMVREEARTPGPPVDTFQESDEKAVCWIQISPSLVQRTILFRWVAPSDIDYRVTRVTVLPGEGIVWDPLPIKGTPAATLHGTWRVDVSVDGTLAASVHFRIRPAVAVEPVEVRSETTAGHRALHTWSASGPSQRFSVYTLNQRVEVTRRLGSRDLTLTLGGGLIGGNFAGRRATVVLGLIEPSRYALFAGLESMVSFDDEDLSAPPTRIARSFVEFVRSTERGDALGLSLAYLDQQDLLTPPASSSATLTGAATATIRRLPWLATLHYNVADIRQRVTAPSTMTTTVGGSIIYFSGGTTVSLTHAQVRTFSGPAPGVAPFAQSTYTTHLRAFVTPQPSLTLGATIGTQSSARDDGALSTQSQSAGVNAAWAISSRARLTGSYQVDRIISQSAGITSMSTTTTGLAALHYQVRPNLSASFTYSPVSTETSTGPPTNGHTLTTTVLYFPSVRMILVGSYSLVRTYAPTLTESGVGSLNLRYSVSSELTISSFVQTSFVRSETAPSADVARLQYGLTVTRRY